MGAGDAKPPPACRGRHAVKLAGLDIEAATALYLQAFVGNLVSSALRLAPIGQTEGQAVVRRLNSVCLDVAKETTGATREDIFSNAFLSDIAAMKHETYEPRLFQS